MHFGNPDDYLVIAVQLLQYFCLLFSQLLHVPCLQAISDIIRTCLGPRAMLKVSSVVLIENAAYRNNRTFCIPHSRTVTVLNEFSTKI